MPGSTPSDYVMSNAGSSVGTASHPTSHPYQPRRPAPGRWYWPIRWWWPSSATTTRSSTTGSSRREGGRRTSFGKLFVAASSFDLRSRLLDRVDGVEGMIQRLSRRLRRPMGEELRVDGVEVDVHRGRRSRRDTHGDKTKITRRSSGAPRSRPSSSPRRSSAARGPLDQTRCRTC